MTQQAAFLADAAQANPDGTFMIWRGGITTSWVASFPGPAQFTMVLRLEFDAAEAAAVHNLKVHIVHAGKEVAPWQTVPIVVQLPPGEQRAHLNLFSEIHLTVGGPGEGVIEGMADEEVRLPLLYFDVRQMPPQGAQGTVGPGAP